MTPPARCKAAAFGKEAQEIGREVDLGVKVGKTEISSNFNFCFNSLISSKSPVLIA